jgi:glucosyl-3-phosphoglycerate synthase
MAVMGTVFSKEVFRTLKAAYFRNALDFVERYKNDAIMNGLDLDVHKEEEAVELFAENIIAAGKNFLSSPHEKPFTPSWSRVRSAMPDIYERLIEAVEEDQREFMEK